MDILDFSNKYFESYFKEIHNLIENTKWGLIYGFIENNGTEDLLNERKLNPPVSSLCVVNQWYKPEKEGFTLRKILV